MVTSDCWCAAAIAAVTFVQAINVECPGRGARGGRSKSLRFREGSRHIVAISTWFSWQQSK